MRGSIPLPKYMLLGLKKLFLSFARSRERLSGDCSGFVSSAELFTEVLTSFMFQATQHDGERRFEMLVRAVYFRALPFSWLLCRWRRKCSRCVPLSLHNVSPHPAGHRYLAGPYLLSSCVKTRLNSLFCVSVSFTSVGESFRNKAICKLHGQLVKRDRLHAPFLCKHPAMPPESEGDDQKAVVQSCLHGWDE